MASDPPSAPDAAYVRQRWVSKSNIEWAEHCNEILMEHGAVNGTSLYDRRDAARWRARKLIRLMCDFGMHERWQLREHVIKHDGGFTWSVEYLRGQSR